MHNARILILQKNSERLHIEEKNCEEVTVTRFSGFRQGCLHCLAATRLRRALTIGARLKKQGRKLGIHWIQSESAVKVSEKSLKNSIIAKEQGNL